MRTLKSILVLGLALSTFTAAEAAKLTFKVTNPNEKVNHAIHTRTPYPLFGP